MVKNYGLCEKREDSKQIFLEELTLYDHLELAIKRYKSKIALVEKSRKLTYIDLYKEISKISGGFLRLGIKNGDKVLIQLPNCIDFVIVSFALFKIGALPIFVLPSYRENEIDEIIKKTKPSAMVINDSYLGFNYKNMAINLKKKHKSINWIINVDKDDENPCIKDFKESNVKYEKPLCNDTAFLILSGGTTSLPKIIPITHSACAYYAKECAINSKVNEKSTYLAILPIAHKFALSMPGVIGTLILGGKVVMCESGSCEEVFPIIENEKVTITSLVPSLINLWLEVLEWDKKHDISSLKVLQVGGAMLSSNTAKEIVNNMQCKLQQVYGTSEGVICFTDLDDDYNVLCNSQGKPISRFDEIKIIDENSSIISNGEYGELLVKGPYTIKSYYEKDASKDNYFTKDGFYRTGDKARIVFNNKIQIVGRLKEQINRAGEKIMPSEIENILCKHNNIKSSAVIAIEDEVLGERSCAFIISDNVNLKKADITKFFIDMGVASNKIPDQMEFVDYFPLTGVGKINKKELKKWILK